MKTSTILSISLLAIGLAAGPGIVRADSTDARQDGHVAQVGQRQAHQRDLDRRLRQLVLQLVQLGRASVRRFGQPRLRHQPARQRQVRGRLLAAVLLGVLQGRRPVGPHVAGLHRRPDRTCEGSSQTRALIKASRQAFVPPPPATPAGSHRNIREIARASASQHDSVRDLVASSPSGRQSVERDSRPSRRHTLRTSYEWVAFRGASPEGLDCSCLCRESSAPRDAIAPGWL